MTQSFTDHLQKLGAEARAHGKSFLGNPFLKTETLPAHSGDSLEVWQRKHDAWDLGWKAEDMMRA